MVVVELRTQHPDHVRWETIAVVRVDGRLVEIDGDVDKLDRELPVLSLTARKQIHFEDDPEEWARSLPTVYHAPDFEAVVVYDTAPAPAPAVERERVVL